MDKYSVLFLVLYCLPLLQAQCCNKKIVSGTVAEAAQLVGEYTLLKDVKEAKDAACFDGCIYNRDGNPGEEYCFQATDGGADIEDQECDAPTGSTEAGGSTAAAGGSTAAAGVSTAAEAGSTAAGGSTVAEAGSTAAAGGSTAAAGGSTAAEAGSTAAAAGSTAAPGTTEGSLRQQAEDAAARVNANNAIIEEDNKKIEKAQATTSAIDSIQAKLTAGATTPAPGRLREKRQVTVTPTNAPTPEPVAKPTSCDDFGDKYKALLNLAAVVTDTNIAQIKVYVDALQDADLTVLCLPAKLLALASETSAKAEAAVQSTKDYAGEKREKVEDLKKKVNLDIALQNLLNGQLVSKGEAPVPTVSQTYAIQPTTPSQSGEEKTPEATSPADGKTPEDSSPAGGKTTESTPPANGKTPEGTPSVGGKTPEGTPPANGKTPEGTPSADGKTPEGTTPSDGKTPEGTPSADGKTPEGTTPSDGKTPEGTPPSDGKTPEGTAPADGKTTEESQPVKTPEGTSPAGEKTQEGTSPADGKTPEGTPPADASTSGGVSTAKPLGSRLLFGRRSRGSLL